MYCIKNVNEKKFITLYNIQEFGIHQLNRITSRFLNKTQFEVLIKAAMYFKLKWFCKFKKNIIKSILKMNMNFN